MRRHASLFRRGVSQHLPNAQYDRNKKFPLLDCAFGKATTISAIQ
jgi:hypothetical protein